ncbi:hypothetical protein D1115_16220 [Vibrio alfacsensis]|uniref:Uncharacterized protein n=1 Tax=Vibrio alfacsensis TaxID=1074311 RepID=A0ABN5PH82_9VIBR|nr:hypothetical protein D1115_16220 [Vibrio alfacsensis]
MDRPDQLIFQIGMILVFEETYLGLDTTRGLVNPCHFLHVLYLDLKDRNEKSLAISSEAFNSGGEIGI